MSAISDKAWDQIKDDVFSELTSSLKGDGLTQSHKNMLLSLSSDQLHDLCVLNNQGDSILLSLAAKEPLTFEAVLCQLPEESAANLLLEENSNKETVFHLLTEPGDFISSMPDLSLVGFGLGADELIEIQDPKQLERDRALMTALLVLKNSPRFESTSAFSVVLESKAGLRRAFEDDPTKYKTPVKQALEAGVDGSSFTRLVATHKNGKTSSRKTATLKFFKGKVEGRKFGLFSQKIKREDAAVEMKNRGRNDGPQQ